MNWGTGLNWIICSLQQFALDIILACIVKILTCAPTMVMQPKHLANIFLRWYPWDILLKYKMNEDSLNMKIQSYKEDLSFPFCTIPCEMIMNNSWFFLELFMNYIHEMFVKCSWRCYELIIGHFKIMNFYSWKESWWMFMNIFFHE